MSPLLPPAAAPAGASARWVSSLLSALFISNAGTFLQFAAQAWWGWEQTHSTSFLGLLALVQASPLLGVPLLGGMLADRFPRRTLLLGTQATLLLVAAGMGGLVLTGALNPPLLLVGAGSLAAVAALDNPVRQVYLPGLVPEPQRARMVGLNALAYNLGAVVGPAAAGLLLPSLGAGGCFLLNAASYLGVWGCVFAGPPGRPTGRGQQTDVGVWRYMQAAPGLGRVLALVAAVSLLGRAYPHVLPALVARLWGGDARSYGALAALPGVGALLAAALVTWGLGRRTAAEYGWMGGLLIGVALVGVAWADNAATAGGALLLVGFAATGTMTLLNAQLQLSVPDGYRGRVMSVYTWLASGAPALGGWLFGMLMGITPAQLTPLVAGALLIGVVLLLHVRLGVRARERPPG